MTLLADAAGMMRRLGPLGALPAAALQLGDRAAAGLERSVLRELRDRLDELPAGRPVSRRPEPRPGDGSPSELMADLLERSLVQDTEEGRRDLATAVLRQLVPDEARILAALTTGPAPPLIHVHARAGGERLLENASLVGRTAALTLPSMTPAYVTHLRQLGLVETGPEDPENAQGYEMLMADRAVRAALKQGELSKIPARAVKRTLRLTDHGRMIWTLTRPPDETPG